MKRFIYINIVLLLTLGAIGCSLDKTPDEQQEAGKIKTTKDIEGLRTGIYQRAKYCFMGDQLMRFDYMSDLLNETSNSGNRGGFFYRWSLQSSDPDVLQTWEDFYRTISRANFLLSKVDDVIDSHPEDKAELENYKGEAYLWRAILFRSLALRFCKDYEPATASQEYGIPIMDQYDITAKPGRGTLAGTYTQILRDIESAEALITTPGSANSTYLTKDCVTALKAQVYLDMHDYGKAIEEVNKLTADYPLATSAAQIEQMWLEDTSTETVFQIGLTQSELSSVLRYADYLGGLWNNNYNNYVNAPGYIPEQWVIDLYDQNNDWRFGPYLDYQYIEHQSNTFPAYVITKYMGNINLRTSASALNWYNMAKLFRMGDLILIKAESEYMSSTGDPLATLNLLRQARGLSQLTGVSGEALLREIQNERMRELIAEGNRIPDIKRWKLTTTRNAQDNLPANYLSTTPTHTMTISYTDNGVLMPIPLSEFASNRNLKGQQNAGYSE